MKKGGSAPAPGATTTPKKASLLSSAWETVKDIYDYVSDQRSFVYIATILWLLELVLNIAIVEYVPYTEIDWVAYMEEVAGPMKDGVWDYSKLEGGTGPLVYPAGFVWVYSVLYWITSGGANIKLAQYLFIGVYLVFIALVFAIYKKSKATPPWLLVFVCLTKRIHSIFVLRLFNDCFAMLFLYLAVYLFAHRRWTFGCIIYSFALSIKMNVLLFLPPLAFLLAEYTGIIKNIPRALLVLAIQVLLGAPFLMENPMGYLHRSFDFGRVFFYKWTVNWKFLPEPIFLSKEWALFLLGLHVLLLLYFLVKWSRRQGIFKIFWPLWKTPDEQNVLRPDYIITLLFTGNFIGIVFARSLHYQFFVWYYHTLPFLLWHTRYPTVMRLAILLVIEVVWNIYPARAISSAVLLAAHLLILADLMLGPLPRPYRYVGPPSPSETLRPHRGDVKKKRTKKKRGKKEQVKQQDDAKQD